MSNQAPTPGGWKNKSIKGHDISRNFNSTKSKNEKLLRIADETDEIFDREIITNDPW